MAHFRCTACRGRVWRDDHADPLARDVCPECGEPLEAVTRPDETVGFRALRPGRQSRQSIADRVRETIARNDAARRRRLRAARGDPPAPGGQ